MYTINSVSCCLAANFQTFAFYSKSCSPQNTVHYLVLIDLRLGPLLDAFSVSIFFTMVEEVIVLINKIQNYG